MTDQEAADYAYDLLETYIDHVPMEGGYGIDVVMPSNPKDSLMLEVVCGSEDDAWLLHDFLYNKNTIQWVEVEGFVVMVEFDF